MSDWLKKNLPEWLWDFATVWGFFSIVRMLIGGIIKIVGAE